MRTLAHSEAIFCPKRVERTEGSERTELPSSWALVLLSAKLSSSRGAGGGMRSVSTCECFFRFLRLRRPMAVGSPAGKVVEMPLDLLVSGLASVDSRDLFERVLSGETLLVEIGTILAGKGIHRRAGAVLLVAEVCCDGTMSFVTLIRTVPRSKIAIRILRATWGFSTAPVTAIECSLDKVQSHEI